MLCHSVFCAQSLACIGRIVVNVLLGVMCVYPAWKLNSSSLLFCQFVFIWSSSSEAGKVSLDGVTLGSFSVRGRELCRLFFISVC